MHILDNRMLNGEVIRLDGAPPHGAALTAAQPRPAAGREAAGSAALAHLPRDAPSGVSCRQRRLPSSWNRVLECHVRSPPSCRGRCARRSRLRSSLRRRRRCTRHHGAHRLDAARRFEPRCRDHDGGDRALATPSDDGDLVARHRPLAGPPARTQEGSGNRHAEGPEQHLELPAQGRSHDQDSGVADGWIVDGIALHQRRSREGELAGRGLRHQDRVRRRGCRGRRGVGLSPRPEARGRRGVGGISTTGCGRTT